MIFPNISLGYATKVDMEQRFHDIFKEAEDILYKSKLLQRKSMHSSLIASIRATMLEKSHETEAHAERLIQLSKEIGVELGLSTEDMNDLELLATLHDIGKMSIDEKIITKAGPLTDDEWMEMKKHPEVGYRIAQASSELASIADYILCHHEKWDGTGYPQGIRGDDIPLLSRIISVVDSYDAMTASDRLYRKAMTEEDAINEISRCSGTQFDPKIVDIFIRLKGSLNQ